MFTVRAIQQQSRVRSTLWSWEEKGKHIKLTNVCVLWFYITDNLRLSGGCSAREGWVEVYLGAAGWAKLTSQKVPISLNDADKACQHLGYPLALAASNLCTTEIGLPEPDLSTFSLATSCSYIYYKNMSECIRESVARCRHTEARFDDSDAWGVVCANGTFFLKLPLTQTAIGA